MGLRGCGDVARLYVHTMGDIGLAEAFCDRVHAATTAQDGKPLLAGQGETGDNDMYLMLIQASLHL